MEEQIQMGVERDFEKLWHHAYNPVLITATFGPTADAVYLVPFEVSGIHRMYPVLPRFKFSWTGSGPAYSFTFRLGLYKLMRGVGGSAGTLVLVTNIGVVARAAPAAGATEYALTATSTSIPQVLDDGIYFMGFQWDDTSLVGSSVSWTAYGATLPSLAGFVYYTDGSNAGSLPATIATFGAATTFQLYFEIT